MHMNAIKVIEKAQAYRDVTAEILSRIIKVPAYSGTEKERIALLQDLCHEAAFEEVRIDGLGNLLARTAVFAHLPNYQEGLGGVLLEALAMEVPVVAFDCGGIGECFTNAKRIIDTYSYAYPHTYAHTYI